MSGGPRPRPPRDPDAAGGWCWDPVVERMPLAELHDLQAHRLKETLRHAYDHVPSYRAKLDEAGIAPEAVRCPGAVADLPFTTEADLRGCHPFGFLAVPREEVARVHASSGTTGDPTMGGCTRDDVACRAGLVARTLAAGGLVPGDRLLSVPDPDSCAGGMGLESGAGLLGCTVLSVSGGGAERQVELMLEFGVAGLSCTPSSALCLAEAARDRGLGPDDLPVRVGYHGAGLRSDQVRVRIEQGLGVDALEVYGLSAADGPGVAFECLCKAGMHVNEDHYLAEVVDPATLEPVPEGTVGELVLTTLASCSQSLIRYRTGDLCSIVYDVCDCGRTFARMTRPAGPADDVLAVRESTSSRAQSGRSSESSRRWP